ncbi:MAG: hypothetical protein OEZ02_14145 [Anaerolineae bacterium]|nr:hypothetical protein [Anaerolineae bacterium]
MGTDVSALAWTLEGDLISLGGRFEYVKSENTSVYKWGARNFISRKLISNVNHSEGWAYWSPNGHYVFTGGFGQPLRLWDIFSGEIVMEQICCSQGNGWSKDSSRLAYMDWQNKISVWDVNKGELIEIGEQGSRVNDVAWTPEGDILALGEKEANYSIWNVESGDQILDLSEHISRRMPINIPGVGLRAISIMADDSIIIWDGYTGERLASFNQPSGIRVVKWSPDGTKLATGDGEGVVRVWDAEKGKMLVENKIDAYSEMIDEMNWSPHGDKLSVQGRLIDTVHVLDASTGKILFVFTDDLPVEIASWSPKGDMLAVGSYLSSGGESVRKLSIWDVVTGNEVSVSENNTGGFWEVAWSPDGKIVASSSSDLLCGWEASTGDKLFCLDVHGGFPSDFDWSPDGSRIASTGYDSPIQVWEVSSGSLLVEIEGPGHGSQDIAWSQNGDFLIADGFIYDADSGKMLLGLEGLWLNDDQIVWFPEESWFITGNGTLRIWGIP